jgi:hypothetical protein
VTTGEIVSIATVVLAILGSMGSTLLLAYRVGRMTGIYDERFKGCDREIGQANEAIGQLNLRVNQHVSMPHGRGKIL